MVKISNVWAWFRFRRIFNRHFDHCSTRANEETRMGFHHVWSVHRSIASWFLLNALICRLDIDRNGFIEKKEMKKIMEVRLRWRSNACMNPFRFIFEGDFRSPRWRTQRCEFARNESRANLLENGCQRWRETVERRIHLWLFIRRLPTKALGSLGFVNGRRTASIRLFFFFSFSRSLV